MHVLIVDDEIYIRELIAKYAKHEQYDAYIRWLFCSERNS